MKSYFIYSRERNWPISYFFRKGFSLFIKISTATSSPPSMNTIISQDLSAVGRYGCLHEFHEARKAAYFKPTARSDMFILVSSRYIYWGKPRSGSLLIGFNEERNRFYPFIVIVFYHHLRSRFTNYVMRLPEILISNQVPVNRFNVKEDV